MIVFDLSFRLLLLLVSLVLLLRILLQLSVVEREYLVLVKLFAFNRWIKFVVRFLGLAELAVTLLCLFRVILLKFFWHLIDIICNTSYQHDGALNALVMAHNFLQFI